MPNYMEAAFAEHEARYRAQVMHETWGHLEPAHGVTYPARVVFAIGETGDYLVIESAVGDLDGSPGLWEELQELCCTQAERRKKPGVFLFQGTYRRFKSGRCRFSGKYRRLTLA